MGLISGGIKHKEVTMEGILGTLVGLLIVAGVLWLGRLQEPADEARRLFKKRLQEKHRAL
jgi:hypothetical protein